MAGYDQKVKVKAAYRDAARDFFSFLQTVGRRYARPVKFNFRYLGRGYFYVMVDGGTGGIDALLQELILNRGLYYYACALRGPHKREKLAHAVIPLFQALLEHRFEQPYSRFIRRHVLGEATQNEFVPGEFKEPFAHEYEILFRKWDLGAIDDWNFIKDLDSLLTQFLLTKIGHESGQRSPAFDALLKQAQRAGIALVAERKKEFSTVHQARTLGLHRRSMLLTKETISETALRLYSYFAYYDEFEQSQHVKTEILHGRRYRRIRYGTEKWDFDETPVGPPIDWRQFTQDHPCHDCAAIQGQYHCEGCDVERCPRCKEQHIGCGCKLQKDF
jgi:hypothetical protein